MMSMNYVLGSLERGSISNESKPCTECGRRLFFSDKWDWKRDKPICMDCIIRKGVPGKKFAIKKQTKDNLRKMGLTDGQINLVSQEAIGYLSKEGRRGIGA